MRAAQNGDRSAFKEIIEKYEYRVAATVISMLGQLPEAEDIGQEVFVRFFRSLRAFRSEASIGTYLTRIAINLSLNEIKRRKHREKLFLPKSGKNILNNIPSKNNLMDNDETREIVQYGIKKLKPGLRAVIVLRLIQGYSTQETAKILKVPLGTVLSRLSRAQKKLKDILVPLYGEKG